MGRFPGETSCLSLVWAVLDLFFSHASNGATFTPAATAPGANAGQRATSGLARSGSSTGTILAHASTHGPSPNSN
jgi:hypothetical protein